MARVPASQRRNAPRRPAPVRDAPATAACSAPAMLDWSAARTVYQSPVGPGRQPEDQCAPPPCTGEGCDCTGGVQGNCDAGLVCCQNGQEVPGGAGTCTAEANCAPPPCTGEGCACNGGVQGACDDGLICCLTDPSVPGGPGSCQPADVCGPPPCTDNGGGCDATCNWGDSCPGCCSGYCNANGLCDTEPPDPVVCTGAGCACTTGTEAPCDEGLICCQTTDMPGGPGSARRAARDKYLL